MRLFMSGLLAASLAASPLYAAECVRPSDHTALDITALRTQLMVTALTCKANDRYDAFVRKYQSDLVREDKSLNSFFVRSYGRAASKQRDDYVTQLANAHSQTGVRQGTLYCGRNIGTFDEVMALRTHDELGDYAAGRAGAQPISTTPCVSIPTSTATSKAPTRSSRRKS